MSTIRLRRLAADFQNLQAFLKRQPRIRLIQTDGTPPERYQLEYQIKSLRQKDEELQTVDSHLVEVLLPLNYPRLPPHCRMLTPIFHPNIAPHAICIGDHWSPGEPLWSMIARIGEMIAYQSYNTKSPLNGEAAHWVEENLARLPLDHVNLFADVDMAPAAASPVPPPLPAPAGPVALAIPAPPPPPSSPAPKPAATLAIQCPQCKTQYRLDGWLSGKWIRCKKCQTLFQAPANPS